MNQEEQTKAHRHFSVACFNAIWDLMDKEQRLPDDVEQMIHLAHVSFWHWMQCSEVDATKISVGYWMLSRVYAVAKQSNQALIYAEKCLDISREKQLEPFYLAYAYEALARASSMRSEQEKTKTYLQKGMEACAQVSDPESQSMVKADLEHIDLPGS